LLCGWSGERPACDDDIDRGGAREVRRQRPEPLWIAFGVAGIDFKILALNMAEPSQRFPERVELLPVSRGVGGFGK
jgi:hypothetical protein